MLKIQLMSDAHGRWGQIDPHPEAHLAVALGDMSDGTEAVGWLAELGMPVIYVPGNHEYYGTDLSTGLDELRRAAWGTNVTVADRQTVTVGAARFICATLWTDHGGMDPDLALASSRALNDWRSIGVEQWLSDPDNLEAYDRARNEFQARWADRVAMFPKNPDRMNPLVALIEHRRALTYLAQEISKPWAGPTIVLTHHAPTLHSLTFAGYFATLDCGAVSSKLSRKMRPHKIGAYANSLDYLLTNSTIELWLHGHLHQGIQFTVNGVGMITNPTGHHAGQNLRYTRSLLLPVNDKTRHPKLMCLTLAQSLSMQSEMGNLLRRCVMGDVALAANVFGRTSDLAGFARAYNQAIAPVLLQPARELRRPEFHLEPLKEKEIIARGQTDTESARRDRHLHDMLTLVSLNERKSKDWLALLLLSSELLGWSPESPLQ